MKILENVIKLSYFTNHNTNLSTFNFDSIWPVSFWTSLGGINVTIQELKVIVEKSVSSGNGE